MECCACGGMFELKFPFHRSEEHAAHTPSGWLEQKKSVKCIMYALDEWSTNAPSHQFVVYRFHLKGKTVRSRCERGYALWRLFQKETLTRVSSPLTVGISYSSVIIVAHAQFMIRKCEKSRYKVNENIGRTHSRMLDIVCTVCVYIYSAHSVFHIQCTFYLHLASQYTCGLFIVIHHEGIHNIKPSAKKKKTADFCDKLPWLSNTSNKIFNNKS